MQFWDPYEMMLWSLASNSCQECFEEYLKTPLYDGKAFWGVEHEIEWLDE